MRKKIIICCLILSIMFIVGACSQKSEDTPNEGNQNAAISEEKIANANAFVDHLESKEFNKAVEFFDENMKNLLPASKLETVWEDLNKQVGAFDKKLGVRTEVLENNDVAYVVSQFKKAKVDIKIVFNQGGEISGLWFQASK